MSQVSVTINGRLYRMACEDGQEAHLNRLAGELDARIGQLRRTFGEIGDTRLTVMAALTIVDELSEAGQKIRRLEDELLALQDARASSAGHAQATQEAIVNALNMAAERIEKMAHRLNHSLAQVDDIALG